MADPERWHLTVDDRALEVAITSSGWGHEIVWRADGDEVTRKKTSDERVVLTDEEAGAIGVRLPKWTGPARRVSYYAPDDQDAATQAHLGVGGVDFDPEPGSAAAEREAWIRAHPHRYAARRVAAAVAGVAVPLLLLWLLARFALPAVPWPDWDLPDLPFPDLPSLPQIPWPDIPWPDLPNWSLPGWVQAVLDVLRYLWPVLLAAVIAYAELKRRRDQDARKRAEAAAEDDCA